MDYVVYGTGYGATLMLLGYAFRTWGPNWRYRDEDERAYAGGELRTARSAWSRFTNGLGAVVSTCGMVLILFTFALMLANPGDGVSEMVSLVLSGLLLIAVAVWAWMYFDRFGVFGVVRAPEALAGQATGPLRYDNRPTQAASSARDEDSADDEEVEPEGEEIAVEEIDEDVHELDEDEAAEMEARYSKFETHHPDETSDESVVAEAVAEDDVQPGSEDVEARASKFETHHPDAGGDQAASDEEVFDESGAEPSGFDEGSEMTETVEAVVVEADDDVVVEEAIDEVEEPVDADAGASTGEAEVVQDAPVSSRPESESESGAVRRGREDALQRLRERQARRARQADDA